MIERSQSVFKTQTIYQRWNHQYPSNLSLKHECVKTLLTAAQIRWLYYMIIRIYFVSTSQVVLHPSKHSLGVNSNHIKKQINVDGKRILKSIEVLNLLKINGENNSIITLKSFKENFNNNWTVRLINPAKNELGRISKAILDTAKKNAREHISKVNLIIISEERVENNHAV